MLSWVVSGLTYEALGSLFQADKKDYTVAMIMGQFDRLQPYGPFVKEQLKKAMGMYAGQSESFIVKPVQDIMKAGHDMFSEDGEVTAKTFERLFSGVSSPLTGIPLGRIFNMGTAVKDASEGNWGTAFLKLLGISSSGVEYLKNKE
jgi:hypothetical protein